MKQLLGGLVLGIVLGAGGLFGYWHFVMAEPDAPCKGRCGEGTVCEAELCVPAPIEPIVEEVVEEPTQKRKGKRRKGKAGASGADEGEGEILEAGAPAWDDDSHVPKFDPNADQVIGANEGSERLSNAVVNSELRELDDEFQACVVAASQRVGELGSGRITIEFGVSSKGKVIGVNAKAPSNLRDAGMIPCVRKHLYAHKFPSFDGPAMSIDHVVEVK
ncbi:MAG: hypothetical protein HC927_13245 [Deltaproteobacteria bacterium]|nr:hypothetical protein [Deltaproteobacteria bacterium]